MNNLRTVATAGWLNNARPALKYPSLLPALPQYHIYPIHCGVYCQRSQPLSAMRLVLVEILRRSVSRSEGMMSGSLAAVRTAARTRLLGRELPLCRKKY